MELAFAPLLGAIAAAHPDREALVWRRESLTWADLTDRTRRLAAALAARRVGRAEGYDGSPWRSPHDHVALYMYNRPAYLEAMVGAWEAGASAFNVNYRYVAEELAYLLDDASAAAIVYEGRFAGQLADVVDRLARRPVLLRVDDGTPGSLLPGAEDYEQALAAADPGADLPTPSGDDRYIVYTGGTTGAPKGVLWRQEDFIIGALGFRRRDGSRFASLDEVVDRASRGDRLRTLPAPPLMHGAAHWNALSTWLAGGTVVIQDHPEHFDPSDVCHTIEREGVTSLLIVGDAFARPLLDHIEARPEATEQLRTLRSLLTGGAILSPAVRSALLDHLPDLHIVDVLGSSESGRQGVARSRRGANAAGGAFAPDPSSVVLSADRSRVLAAGEDETGWLAQSGHVPLAYLGDPAKTEATFPVVAGVRHVVPGDRARAAPDGSIDLLGREAATINSGGEKIFAEEVERALKHHPAVSDALVVGRPSERWGQEVTAVVSLRDGAEASPEEVLAECGRHVARYKLPKALVRVATVSRSPSGKPDYAWARERVADASPVADGWLAPRGEWEPGASRP